MVLDEWIKRIAEEWNVHGKTYAYRNANTIALRLMLCRQKEKDLTELVETYGGEIYTRCWRASSDAAVEFLYDVQPFLSEVRMLEFDMYVELWQLLHVIPRGKGARKGSDYTKVKNTRRDLLLVLMKSVQEKIEHMKMFERAALIKPKLQP